MALSPPDPESHGPARARGAATRDLSGWTAAGAGDQHLPILEGVNTPRTRSTGPTYPGALTRNKTSTRAPLRSFGAQPRLARPGERHAGPDARGPAGHPPPTRAPRPRRPHSQAGVVAVGRPRGLRAAVVSGLRVQEQVVLALVAPRAGPGRQPGRAAPAGREHRALVHGASAGLAEDRLSRKARRRAGRAGAQRPRAQEPAPRVGLAAGRPLRPHHAAAGVADVRGSELCERLPGRPGEKSPLRGHRGTWLERVRRGDPARRAPGLRGGASSGGAAGAAARASAEPGTRRRRCRVPRGSGLAPAGLSPRPTGGPRL